MYSFGQSSKSRIEEVNELLQKLAFETIKKSPYDFGVLKYGGLRTAEEQKELFDKGVTQCDGTDKKSYHQTGMAIDFVPYVNGKYTWDNEEAFLAIAKTALEVWESLSNKKGYHLHWGGFWKAKDLNNNNLLDKDDKLGWDMPHYELRTSKQTKGVYPIDWA